MGRFVCVGVWVGERTTDPEKSTTFQNKGFRVQKVCSETERETKRGSEGLRRVMILSDLDLHCVQDKTAQNRSTSCAVHFKLYRK